MSLKDVQPKTYSWSEFIDEVFSCNFYFVRIDNLSKRNSHSIMNGDFLSSIELTAVDFNVQNKCCFSNKPAYFNLLDKTSQVHVFIVIP